MTTSDAIIPPPSVMWAQRAGYLIVTVNLEDCKDPEIKLEKQSVLFRGMGGSDHKMHEVTMNLYKEIDPEKSKYCVRDRCTEFMLVKANTDGPWWPKLTSDKEKQHWLKSDFNKWKDEDDSDGEMMEGGGGMGGAGGGDFEEMMRQMGGLGGGGGPMMGGGGPMGMGKPSLDDLDAPDGDSDDEELPDLE